MRIGRSLPRWLILLPIMALLAGIQPPRAYAAVPRVEAEDFVRFSDSDVANRGNSTVYRAPGPDVYTCSSSSNTCSNGHKVSAFSGGEWLEFDVDVPSSQLYRLLLRYGTRSTSASVELLIDGASVTNRVALPNTGHYDTLREQPIVEVELASGMRAIRVIAHGPFSFDSLELQPLEPVAPSATPSASPTPAPSAVPPAELPTPAPSAVPPAELPTSASTWQRWEVALTSAKSYANPYADVTLRVTFRSPEGRELATYGFWDGGATFKIRAMFPSPGRWTWETSASDSANTALHGVRGSVQVEASTSDNPLVARGALQVSADGRYLTHADGTPFLWLGDTAWAAPLKASQPEWETYVNDRTAKRFSVLMVAPSPSWSAASDVGGNRPWNGPPGAQWNPAYWQGFEQKIAYANSRGLVVLVVGVMEPNGVDLPEAEARRFARQLVGRLHGNHVIFSPSFDSPYSGLGNSIGAELDAATSLHLVTQHPGTPTGQTTNVHAERYFPEAYLSFSSNQTGHNNGNREQTAVQEIRWNLSLAARLPAKPVINLEGYYDNAGGQPGDQGWARGTAKDARAGAYRSWLSGALGYSYGTVGLYQWETDPAAPNNWRTVLGYGSSQQMTTLRDLLAEMPWHTLAPDHARLRNQPTAWSERTVFAITADRQIGLVYTPLARPIALDMTAFAAPVRAMWLNPVTGERTPLPDLVPNTAVVQLTPPQGGEDWVLLLRP